MSILRNDISEAYLGWRTLCGLGKGCALPLARCEIGCNGWSAKAICILLPSVVISGGIFWEVLGPGASLCGFSASSRRYQFALIGYVIMPDHVHLLISESSLV